MTVQTTYTKEAQVALPGLIYDLGNTNIDSFSAEAVIPFGRFVARGTLPNDEVLLGGAASIGVSVRTAGENKYQGAGASVTQYEITDTVGVLRNGFIWAEFDAAGGSPEDAVTINASGQVIAAGGGTALTA
ncbi:hypothetical protein GOV07_03235, partial [Candidatus Woesearchaeota archaeon]|nr:hypothetical protein [Candidatus Woesearchaeota archaeon]